MTKSKKSMRIIALLLLLTFVLSFGAMAAGWSTYKFTITCTTSKSCSLATIAANATNTEKSLTSSDNYYKYGNTGNSLGLVFPSEKWRTVKAFANGGGTLGIG